MTPELKAMKGALDKVNAMFGVPEIKTTLCNDRFTLTGVATVVEGTLHFLTPQHAEELLSGRGEELQVTITVVKIGPCGNPVTKRLPLRLPAAAPGSFLRRLYAHIEELTWWYGQVSWCFRAKVTLGDLEMILPDTDPDGGHV